MFKDIESIKTCPVVTDLELYGLRREGLRILEAIKQKNESECIVVGVRTFSAHRRYSSLENISNYHDKRIKNLLDKLNLQAPLPIQQYIWPLFEKSSAPVLAISQQSSGKTFSSLLYILFEAIKSVPPSLTEDTVCAAADETGIYEPEKVESETQNVGYIIICSSQIKVNELYVQLDNLKGLLYETSTKVTQNLQPRVVALHWDDTNDSIILKSVGKQVIIATPSTIFKYIDAGLLNMDLGHKLIFDDLDMSLQLNSQMTRELVKSYLISSCMDVQIFLFARKWTELVRNFVNVAMPQILYIFGSIIEAGLYNNISFEISEYSTKSPQCEKIVKVIKESEGQKTCITCRSLEEANEIKTFFDQSNFNAQVVDPFAVPEAFRDKSLINLKTSNTPSLIRTARSTNKDKLFIIPDCSVDLSIRFMTDIKHLVHYDLPDDIMTFERRFRLMINSIKNEVKLLKATVFKSKNINTRAAKMLLDIVSRSPATLLATKLELKDSLVNDTDHLCWRWASLGICRLTKLNMDDRLGTYCFARHNLMPTSTSSIDHSNYEVRITITHIVNPNEFYFWLDAHRDINSPSGEWTIVENAGSRTMKSLQCKLDNFKTMKIKTISYKLFKRDKVYGIFLPQESKVVRVILLEDPLYGYSEKTTLDEKYLHEVIYDLQIEAFQVDFGVKFYIYLKNLFDLPLDLAQQRPLAKRGYHVGYKPAGNEPDWLFEAKRSFSQQVFESDNSILTAWTRYNQADSFWLENLTITETNLNINSESCSSKSPHSKLYDLGYADSSNPNLKFVAPSNQVETQSKWMTDKAAKVSQYAFVRTDKPISAFILDINRELNVTLRYSEYNNSLIEIEDSIMEDFLGYNLEPLAYFEVGIICVVKVTFSIDSEGKEVFYFNRGRIDEILPGGSSFKVTCLDHGDKCEFPLDRLYQAKVEYIQKLPFQAITKKLAGFNYQLISDKTFEVFKTKLYHLTRDTTNCFVKTICLANEEGVYIYNTQLADADDVDKGEVCFPILADLLQDQQLADAFELDNEEDDCSELLSPFNLLGLKE